MADVFYGNQQPQQPQPQQVPDSMVDQITEPAFPTADPNFLKKRIETTSLLLELRHSLKGEIIDLTGKKWEQYGTPAMNDVGVNVCMTILIHYVNPNTLFAELTREDIDNIMFGFCGSLRTALVCNRIEWEIGDIDTTHRAIVDFVFFTLSRALNRGEAKSIGNLQTIQRTIVNRGESKSRLPFFGKKG